MSKPLVKPGEGQRQDFDWGHIEWSASGQIGNSATMTFGRVTIKSGRANGAHKHPNCDEILHLISGELEHRVGDETYRMKPGDTIVLSAGVRHGAHSIGAEDAVMVVAYSSASREVKGE